MRVLRASLVLVALCLLTADALVIRLNTTRGLCCPTGPSGSTFGLPQFNPFAGVPNAGCPVGDAAFLSAVPVAVYPNSSFVEGAYPR